MIEVTLALITLSFILITLIFWVSKKPFLTLISLGITIGFMLSTYIVDIKKDDGPKAIDVYKGKTEAQSNFLKYLLFVSFFPQLVAGPIERSVKCLTNICTNTCSATYKLI